MAEPAAERPDAQAGPAGEQPRFEEALARLEQIVHALEAGNLSLDESLRVFEDSFEHPGCAGRIAGLPSPTSKVGTSGDRIWMIGPKNASPIRQ